MKGDGRVLYEVGVLTWARCCPAESTTESMLRVSAPTLVIHSTPGTDNIISYTMH